MIYLYHPTDNVGPETIKDERRALIREEVADPQSVLGTTADAAALALTTIAKLLKAISTSSSLTHLKTQAQALSEGLVDKVLACENAQHFPYQHKGLEATLEDIKTRNQPITAILKRDVLAQARAEAKERIQEEEARQDDTPTQSTD